MKGSVGKFSVAASHKWNKDGQLQEKTTWFNCDLFGKMATGVGQYITKGSLIQVVGRIETSEYNGKYYWSVNVQNVTLLGKKNGDNGDKPQEKKAPNLDDIPF